MSLSLPNAAQPNPIWPIISKIYPNLMAQMFIRRIAGSSICRFVYWF